VALAIAVAFDRPLSAWAQSWPEAVRGALEQITPYGESDWILYPSAGLFVLTALVALFVRWKLMRTMLWQFAALYAFFFVGVGLPSLISTLVKRLIGRARPMHFDEVGTLRFNWNWLDWTYQSFPSGHATTAFALATVIGFISPRWFYPGLALAAVIGISRISMGVHYPSDVVAGAILGLLGAYLVRWIFAKRGWIFSIDPAGRIVTRPMSSLKRYLTLKRRGTVRAQLPDRP
jgi:undecaprenyl-diphosphatase